MTGQAIADYERWASALGKIFPLQHSSDIPLARKNADDANRSILHKEVKAYGFESVYGPGAKVFKFRVPEVARGSCVGMAANLFRGFFDGFFKALSYMRDSKRDQVVAKLTDEIGLRGLAVGNAH